MIINRCSNDAEVLLSISQQHHAWRNFRSPFGTVCWLPQIRRGLLLAGMELGPIGWHNGITANATVTKIWHSGDFKGFCYWSIVVICCTGVASFEPFSSRFGIRIWKVLLQMVSLNRSSTCLANSCRKSPGWVGVLPEDHSFMMFYVSGMWSNKLCAPPAICR